MVTIEKNKLIIEIIPGERVDGREMLTALTYSLNDIIQAAVLSDYPDIHHSICLVFNLLKAMVPDASQLNTEKQFD